MNAFKRAFVPQSEIETLFADLCRQWKEDKPGMRKAFPQIEWRDAKKAIRAYLKETAEIEQWRNDTYQVAIRRESKTMAHLSIKRNDRACIHDWRELQAIKNELIGPENEAVELYPAESRLVDTANQYHLWVVLDSAFRFPFGFGDRLVGEEPVGKSVNRPFA